MHSAAAVTIRTVDHASPKVDASFEFSLLNSLLSSFELLGYAARRG